MSKFSWRLGITTAPRRKILIDQTLSTLLNAGWDAKEIFVRAEPHSLRPEQDIEWRENETRLGAYANWHKLLLELAAEPPVDFYGIVQDDVSVWRGLRSYLEKSVTAGSYEVYQPYTSAIESRARPRGWYRCRTGRALCGAHFFVFPAGVLAKIIEIVPPKVPENKHIDAYLAQALNDHGIPFFQHIPSLAQHLGDTLSTLGYPPDPGCRIATDFIGVNGDLEPPAATT